MISADMEDSKSIEEMVKRARVLMNACGPLRRHGETVIQACLKHRTHHVDISAEPNFIEKVELEYNEEARKRDVYIVGSCGVDSITYDMGLFYLEKKLGGTLNSVEAYLRYGSDNPSLPGPDLNCSTWKSVIDLMTHTDELKQIRKGRNNKLPNLEPKLKAKYLPFKPKVDEGWAIPLFSADLSIMRRTQQYLYKEKKRRPIQIQTYMMLTEIWHFVFLLLFSSLALLTKLSLGRKLLLKYPSFFSGGFFGEEEPTEEKLESGWVRLTIHGKGWKEKLLHYEDQFNYKPNTELIVTVTGRNHAYRSTALCLVLAGIMLLTEPENLPKRGGVFTPGGAFGETSLAEQLNENGIKIELIKMADI
ncbi:hypothetical protein HHI36_009577 [Cryptolaemus montrouzieri]|uniref:Saccharopine dehydrogenase NADP binding domain-containing protein n=1 Tax=Cryptolaemus montrouzieri TaxID=559131 RepID=A0ABD2MG84_9CUCU